MQISALRENDAINEVYKQAMETIRDLESRCKDFLFTGPVGVEAEFTGKTRADIDNLGKGILDSLERIFYENDRQVKKQYSEIKDY